MFQRMDMRETLRPLAIAGATIVSLWVVDAEASTKCFAAKARCVSETVHGLLRCYEKAARRGVDASADADTLPCTQKVASRLDGRDDGHRGCFERAETRADASRPRSVCLTTDDAAEVGAQVNGWTSS